MSILLLPIVMPIIFAPIYIGGIVGLWVRKDYNNGVLLTEFILSLALGAIIFIKPLSSSTLYIPVSAALSGALWSSIILIGLVSPKGQLLKINMLYIIMVISATLAFSAAIVWL